MFGLFKGFKENWVNGQRAGEVFLIIQNIAGRKMSSGERDLFKQFYDLFENVENVENTDIAIEYIRFIIDDNFIHHGMTSHPMSLEGRRKMIELTEGAMLRGVLPKDKSKIELLKKIVN